MLDTFAAVGKPSVLAASVYRVLTHPDCAPEDIVYGTVFLSNESMGELKDFTLQDLQFMLGNALYWCR
jgi:hypothetical protein